MLVAATERNERENLSALTEYLALYREYQGRGDVSELQVGQVEQQILSSQTNLLRLRQNLALGLDRFKLQLGLPTLLPLELDDGPSQPMKEMLAEFGKSRDDFIALRDDADRFHTDYRLPLLFLAGTGAAPIPIEVPLRGKIQSLMLDSTMAKNTKLFRAKTASRWERWRKLSLNQLKAELKLMADEYRELYVRQARVEATNQKLPPADEARLELLPPEIALGQLELSLRNYESLRTNAAATNRGEAVLYEETVNNFMRVMNEARKERRSLIRAAWPSLPAVAVDGSNMLTDDLERAQTVAEQVALANRMELMNARAAVVDAWRQIAVQANSLLGVANVGYNFQSPSTPNANEPFALGGARSTHQLILNGELPLVRRAERNAYRTALVAYQRARRNLQATEDFILTDVRNDLRSLRVLAENYRIQKRAVEVAYDQVESSLDVLQSPPEPVAAIAGQPGQAAAQGNAAAGQAAALTQQLLNAQNSLLKAQNDLYTVWINYLIARMTLYRDIERLPLDARGVWIDESRTSSTLEAIPTPDPVGAAEPDRFAELR